jgi:hypothetical protein
LSTLFRLIEHKGINTINSITTALLNLKSSGKLRCVLGQAVTEDQRMVAPSSSEVSIFCLTMEKKASRSFGTSANIRPNDTGSLSTRLFSKAETERRSNFESYELFI